MPLKRVDISLIWRNYNAPSILFKSILSGLLAGLTVSIVSTLHLALIVGATAAGLAVVKYTIRAYTFNKNQQETVGLNNTNLKHLQLLSEHRKTFGLKERCEVLSAALIASNQASQEACNEITENILNSTEFQDVIPDDFSLIQMYLPENAIDICIEDFCDEDDHAMLVELFVNSTNGKWVANNLTSTYDDDNDRWLVNFEERGAKKTWRFSQHAYNLNMMFLDLLVQYTQDKSGNIVRVIDSIDNSVQVVSLPAEVYNVMYQENSAERLAA